MSILIEKLIINYPYFFAVILLVIGALTVLTRSSLFKKLFGISIMAVSYTHLDVYKRQGGMSTF